MFVKAWNVNWETGHMMIQLGSGHFFVYLNSRRDLNVKQNETRLSDLVG